MKAVILYFLYRKITKVFNRLIGTFGQNGVNMVIVQSIKETVGCISKLNYSILNGFTTNLSAAECQ